MKNEKIREAVVRAAELLKDNNLLDWSVSVNANRKSLAWAEHRSKEIGISKFFIYAADKEMFDGVILHEVAHALLGFGYGHGKEFVEVCTNISPTDKYAVGHANVEIHRYRFTCPQCGLSGTHNSGRDKACLRCSTDDNNVVFIKSVNTVKLKEW